ncbi:MAG: DUF4230 domain-containing protein [Tetrasphaera sp.]|nr:DUF4230 domain-containing protein [Tetrasphaera sp.]
MRRLLDLLARLLGAAVILALLLGGAALLGGWRPSLDVLRSLNIFTEETIDRTGPSVLDSLNDLSEYHAASAHYETVVDIEKDTRFLPSWVSGERVLYVAKGDVDAIIDFGELDERRVQLSEDGTSVTVHLPSPTVGKPVLDIEGSYVAHQDAGVVNRFKGSELEREAQLKALEQMTAAAHEEGRLLDLAKDNTVAMLRGLFSALEIQSTITFDEIAG